MSSMTATILIGSAHQNHGGVNPTHHLLLSENSRPAWILMPIEAAKPKAVWIPTVEDMLEDGLLMVGLLVVRDESLVAAAKFNSGYDDRASLYDDITEADRRHLYGICRRVGVKTKLIVSVFEGSSIAGQLGMLAGYQFGVEVCPSVYRRELSAWSGKVELRGTLPTTEGGHTNPGVRPPG